MKKYVIGVDYGTDSCRVLIVDVANGNEVASSVKYYSRWQSGKYCDPAKNQYRQHPLDYTETLTDATREALAQSPAGVKENIVGIAFDTTGSTPVLTDESGTPLALLPEFSENPNAMFVLWKDHTAVREMEQINTLAKQWRVDYTAYSGGIYSSEWVWSKILHVLRADAALRFKAYAWAEHCDWICGLITGNTKPETMLRSRCAAGHKAMWHETWDGLPAEDFLIALDPLLKGFRSRLYDKTFTCDTAIGNLNEEWAEKLGLTTNVVVAVGALDCHMGAVGAQIREGSFVRVIGTSTCDIMVVNPDEMNGKLIPGICGQVDGSVIPGLVGLEAGQSAFGDLFDWYKRILEWAPLQIINQSKAIGEKTKQQLNDEISNNILSELTKEAEKIPLQDSSLIATDWMNGRRTPDANQLLTGSITGLTLGTTAPLIYRAIIEATAFGSKAIFDRFIENNIKIEEVIGIGGISQKSPFVMQVLSDVLGVPIKVVKSSQACALGAAMFASVAAGVHPTIEHAQQVMGQGFEYEYKPNMENHAQYMKMYEKYRHLGKHIEELS